MNYFKNGDKVVISDNGKIYPVYSRMATLLGATNWTERAYTSESNIKDKHGKVINSGKHLGRYDIIYLVELEDSHQILIGEEGLTLVESVKNQPISIDEAFAIRQRLIDSTKGAYSDRSIIQEILLGTYDRIPDKVVIAKDDLEFRRING